MVADLPIQFSLIQDPELSTTWQKTHSLHFHELPFSDIQGIRDLAKILHSKTKFDGVISFTEYGLYPAALIKEDLGIPGNTLAPVLNTRDKLKMRRVLESKKFPDSVRFVEVNSFQEAKDFFVKINGPVIIKKIDGSGKDGVYKSSSYADLEKIFRDKTCHFICEEFIEGDEFSVESLTFEAKHQIVAITEKKVHPVSFVELGHRMPARLSKDLEEQVVKRIESFLSAIGQTFGPAHTEIKINSKGIFILESHTRPGGGFIWELVLETTGIDFVRETIAKLVGLSWKRIPISKVGLSHMLVLENVKINDIRHVAELKHSPGVVRAYVSVEQGQILGRLQTNDDRAGVIVVVGDDYKDVEQKIEKALSVLKIDSEQISGKKDADSSNAKIGKV